MNYHYPYCKFRFFEEHPKLCKKFLTKEKPEWYFVGLQDFMKLARKEIGYSKKTFWQDIWHPLKYAYDNYKLEQRIK